MHILLRFSLVSQNVDEMPSEAWVELHEIIFM